MKGRKAKLKQKKERKERNVLLILQHHTCIHIEASTRLFCSLHQTGQNDTLKESLIAWRVCL